MTKYYFLLDEENIIGNIQAAGNIEDESYVEISEDKMVLDFSRYIYDKENDDIKLKKEIKYEHSR